MALLLGVVLFLLLCAGLFRPLERCFPHRGRTQAWSATLICLGLFGLNTVLMQLVAAPLLEAMGTWVVLPVSDSMTRIVITLAVADLAAYGIHRLMHASPFLWRFHRVHHGPEDLTWLEAWRQHSVDFMLHGLVVGIPGVLLGVDLSSIVALVLLRKVWTSFLHADVAFRFGWLEWVVATPAYHRLHHSQDAQFRNRNFSGTLLLWDLLFGTAAVAPPEPEVQGHPLMG